MDNMGRTQRNMALRTSTLPSRGSHEMQETRSPKGVRDSVLSRTPGEKINKNKNTDVSLICTEMEEQLK